MLGILFYNKFRPHVQRRRSLFCRFVCNVSCNLEQLALFRRLHEYKVSVPGDPSTYAQDDMLEAIIAVIIK